MAAILLCVFVGKDVHVLLHDHNHGIDCSASGTDRHFHDNETPTQHCHLCQISCPTFDDSIDTCTFINKEIPTLVISFDYIASFGTRQEYIPPLRGPPAKV